MFLNRLSFKQKFFFLTGSIILISLFTTALLYRSFDSLNQEYARLLGRVKEEGRLIQILSTMKGRKTKVSYESLLGKVSEDLLEELDIKNSVLALTTGNISQEESYSLIDDLIERIEADEDMILDKIGDLSKKEFVKLLLGFVLFDLIIILVIVFVYFQVVPPLVRVMKVLEEMSDGNFLMSLPKISRDDEIGSLWKILRKTYKWVGDTFISVARNMREIIEDIGVIEEDSHQLGQIASAEHEQAQQLATAAEEMSQTVAEIAKNASVSAENSKKARILADQGAEKAQMAIKTMEEVIGTTKDLSAMIEKLHSRVSEIEDIVSVVSEIADQTSLLSLNAAIEAARAGEQGRGFAVVADEVKKLAERTLIATEEISQKISTVQRESNQTTSAMQKSIAQVEKAQGQVNTLVESLNEIKSAADVVEEQITMIASAVEEEAQVSSEMVKRIEEILSLAGSTAESSQKLDSQVKSIRKAIDTLRKFLGEIKSKAIFEIVEMDHRVWVNRIRWHLEGKIQLDDSDISDAHSCNLGKWYYSYGKRYFSHIPVFKEIEQPHEKVHDLGKEIVALVNAGHLERAKLLFGELESTAERLLNLISQLAQAIDEE